MATMQVTTLDRLIAMEEELDRLRSLVTHLRAAYEERGNAIEQLMQMGKTTPAVTH